MTPLKIAFVGGSFNSAVGRAHFSAINIDKKFELVCGCFSLDSDENILTANAYGVERDRVYPSLESLIQHEKDHIDCIAILTPTNLHYEHVLTCIENNIPVICEKALAVSHDEALQLLSHSQKKNAFVKVIYNYLGYPMLRELRAKIKRGDLGILNQLHIEMPQEGFEKVDNLGNPIVPQEWRLSDYSIPTLSLDLGTHTHMISKYLLGKLPLRVTAFASNFGNFSSIVDDINCLIEYEDQVICNCWYSKVALGMRNGLKIRIFGTEASAEWIQENPECLTLSDRSGQRVLLDRGSPDLVVANESRYLRFKPGHPSGFIEAFANYYCDIFTDLQRHFENPTGTFFDNSYGISESVEGLNLLSCIQLSSNEQQWIQVS